jgi:hypothetical protein
VERDDVSADPFAGAAADRRSLTGRVRSVDGLLAVVAAVLLPLGLVVILLGWYGASHTPYLFEQVPYLISGGLIGLGLVLTGGLLYFGSWIARSAAQQQRTGEELTGLLKEIRDELRARPAVEAATPTRKAANGKGEFVATAKGSMLHRPDCSVVVGRDDLHAVSGDGGLQPCGLCAPLSTDPHKALR